VGDIDALFQLPPDQFTAARNDLAARLKAAGKPDEAARVKGLAKPPLSAWVVNQLFWRQKKSFDRLMTAGERLRNAQASQLKGGGAKGGGGKGSDLREPLEARRLALGELSKDAASLLRESGHAASPDLMRKISTTLEALATFANHPSAPQAGHLTADIAAPGFEALAALIPREPASAFAKATADKKAGLHNRKASDEPFKVIPFARKQAPARSKDPKERKKQEDADRRARLAAATAAIQAAEESLAEARKAAARAEGALKKAAARAKETQREKEAAGARYEKLTAGADTARQDARKVAAEAEDAAQAVEDAEREVEEARRTKAALASGE
jgi:hypothetical protein